MNPMEMTQVSKYLSRNSDISNTFWAVIYKILSHFC